MGTRPPMVGHTILSEGLELSRSLSSCDSRRAAQCQALDSAEQNISPSRTPLSATSAVPTSPTSHCSGSCRRQDRIRPVARWWASARSTAAARRETRVLAMLPPLVSVVRLRLDRAAIRLRCARSACSRERAGSPRPSGIASTWPRAC